MKSKLIFIFSKITLESVWKKKQEVQDCGSYLGIKIEGIWFDGLRYISPHQNLMKNIKEIK